MFAHAQHAVYPNMRCGLSDHKPKEKPSPPRCSVPVVVAIGIQVIFRDCVLYCDGRGKLE